MQDYDKKLDWMSKKDFIDKHGEDAYLKLLPKTEIAKHETMYGKQYQFLIFEALKNGEGVHDERYQGRRMDIKTGISCNQELFDKLVKATNKVITEHMKNGGVA